jgi:putative membrane protein
VRLHGWFDSDESRELGTTPDYRYSLANERTFLAWLRTGLALIGGGLAVAQFLPPGSARVVLAIALLLLGGAVAIRAVDRWARTERAMRLGDPLPPSRFPAVLALAIGAGAIALAAGVAAGVMRS